MTNNQAAARSLAQRALRASTQSESALLIRAAQSLDQTIDGDRLRSKWIEKWLKQRNVTYQEKDGPE